ncbi:MAG: nucleoside deaminase [Proteobacteria bacterium]|nr:nucleoside deaminase [Pseudomonadota bacterium]
MKSLSADKIELAKQGVDSCGGPFGALVVKDGKIISEAYNEVTHTNDPTAHAEVLAIRRACKTLNTFDLSDCEIYSSCEPCPMCLGAIYWARIKKLYHSSTREDAENAGFDDSIIYREFELKSKKKRLLTERVILKKAYEPFILWKNKEDKICY